MRHCEHVWVIGKPQKVRGIIGYIAPIAYNGIISKHFGAGDSPEEAIASAEKKTTESWRWRI